MVGDTRQGWAILGAMTVIFVVMAGVAMWAEQQGNPLFSPLGVDQAPESAAGRRQHGGQGDALRHRRLGAVRDHHDGGVLRRGQCRCTIPSRRSAGSCRCG